MKKETNPTLEQLKKEGLDILHECIQHTPIKLEQTNGTDTDKQ